MYHQYVVYGESRYYILISVWIGCVEKSILSLAPSEIVDRLPRKSVISRYCICIQYLRSCIHYIRKLLIKRTIHVCLVHAPSERSETDIPNALQGLIRCPYL